MTQEVLRKINEAERKWNKEGEWQKVGRLNIKFPDLTGQFDAKLIQSWRDGVALLLRSKTHDGGKPFLKSFDKQTLASEAVMLEPGRIEKAIRGIRQKIWEHLPLQYIQS